MNDPNKRTGTDMVEDLSALVFDTDEFPSSAKAKEILAERGIETDELKSWASEKLKGVLARQKMAVARERRISLESRLDALRQSIAGSASALRERVLSKIRVLGDSDPEAAQVYCRKFEEMPDEDLADLDAELSMLEELEGEDGSGNQG
jgi:hypothetical protein